MTDFDTLSQHEQALAMLLAYFDDYSKSKSTILGLGYNIENRRKADGAGACVGRIQKAFIERVIAKKEIILERQTN